MAQPRGMKIRIFCRYLFSFPKLYVEGETRINHKLSSEEDHFVKEKKIHIVTPSQFYFMEILVLPDPLYIHTGEAV